MAVITDESGTANSAVPFPRQDLEHIYDDPIDIVDFLREQRHHDESSKMESEVSSLKSVYRVAYSSTFSSQDHQVIFSESGHSHRYDICGICFEKVALPLRSPSLMTTGDLSTSSSNRAVFDDASVIAREGSRVNLELGNESEFGSDEDTVVGVAMGWPSGECGCKFCSDCVSAFIESKITSGDASQIKCPDCCRSLKETDVRAYLSDPTILMRYERLLKNAAILSNPNAIFCPIADCDGYGFTEGSSTLSSSSGKHSRHKVSCDTCQSELCFTCQSPWHGTISCEKAQQKALKKKSHKDKSERKFSVWAKERTKKCPQCRTVIEKLRDGSCNHMTCGVCKTEFCWLCGKSIPPEGHFDIDNVSGCPGMQYSDYTSKRNRYVDRGKSVAHYSKITAMYAVGVPVMIVAAVPIGIFYGVKAVSSRYMTYKRMKKIKKSNQRMADNSAGVERDSSNANESEFVFQSSSSSSYPFPPFTYHR